MILAFAAVVTGGVTWLPERLASNERPPCGVGLGLWLGLGLAGPGRLAVLFHELGHFLFHAPETGPSANFHGVGGRTRKECEADIFALCALVPRPWIESRSIRELIDDEGFTAEMIAARLAIFERHGI